MLIKQKHLFSDEECKNILLNINSNITNWNSIDRKYDSQVIIYSLKTKWIFEKLKSFVELETDIRIEKLKNQIHYHTFKKGDWFGKHNDVRDNRIYAVGVLLNDSFEGGEFKLYDLDEYVLNKSTGNTYIFDVNVEHEITPILEGERHSMLWFLQIEHIKIEKNKLI